MLRDWFKTQKVRELKKYADFDREAEEMQAAKNISTLSSRDEQAFADTFEKPDEFEPDDDPLEMKLRTKLRQYSTEKKVEERDVEIIKLCIRNMLTSKFPLYKQVAAEFNLSDRQIRRILKKFKDWCL